MQFLPITLALCFFLAFFQIYRQSREDFTLTRKNVSLEQVFNLAILTGLVGLALSRLIFALEKGGDVFVTFFSPYVPGLSLSGGLIGGLLFLVLILRRRKLPLKKLLDIFSLATITVLPIGYLWALVSSPKSLLFHGIILLVSFCLFLFFTLFLYPRSLRGELKEGTVTVLFFLSYAILSLCSTLLLGNIRDIEVFLQPEFIVLIGIFLVSIVLLFISERKKLFRTRR